MTYLYSTLVTQTENIDLFHLFHCIHSSWVSNEGEFMLLCIHSMEFSWVEMTIYIQHYKLDVKIKIYIYIYMNWITMTRKFSKHSHAAYRTLNSCFDLIGSHQQCIPWSPSLEINPATTKCRIKTVQLGYWTISHISNAKSTSHGKCTTA